MTYGWDARALNKTLPAGKLARHETRIPAMTRHKNTSPFSDEDVIQALLAFWHGESVTHLAERVGAPYTTVLHWIHRITRRHCHIAAEKRWTAQHGRPAPLYFQTERTHK